MENMELSAKVRQLEASPTLAISTEAKKLKDSGKEVISLGAGEPDFNTPQHINQAAIDAVNNGFTGYTETIGIKELREAVTKDLAKRGLEYDNNQVIVTTGAKYALFTALQSIIEAGDEVILPAPYWVSYPEQIKFAEGKVVAVETKEENRFKMTAEEFAAAITEDTKAVVINSPSNPTGAVYTKEELQEIAEVAVDNDILVISDEIYQKITYDTSAVSIAELGSEIKDRTIIIDGVSKAYAMTGWRIGYAVAPKDVITAMGCLQSHSTSNPNSIAQKASTAALTGSQEPTKKMVKAFQRRRDLLVDLINSIPGFETIKPSGAFYLFVNVKELIGSEINGTVIKDDQELADVLLHEAGVATIPGSFFGKDGYLRISYAIGEEDLKRAAEKIKDLVG
ncbi:pyridoxal phosphate-dependent aminotransferase [Halanaerobacter jeridensis]|uniref:Aminotransferase n=1 Tax=Halanaerobacter jeridensis TaxID=706427 RepID=A0A938XQE4_9FIRM|nr:pyridoxal phosphate-dependent aminotransferase [Halanaerobacter jeridensis]MBM7555571.1 aspartate aminotransferase [Halanaerobacter jeridensis]